MLKLEPLHDLILNRGCVYSGLALYDEIGLDVKVSLTELNRVMSILATAPSFKFEYDHFEWPDITRIVAPVSDNSWAIPFNEFSFVLHERSLKRTLVYVIAKDVEADGTQTLLIYNFSQSKDWDNTWTVQLPVRFSIETVDGGCQIVPSLALKPGVSQEQAALAFCTLYDSFDPTVVTASEFYSDYVQLVMMTFSDTVATISAGGQTLLKPARECASVHKASKMKKAFWEYHIVQLAPQAVPTTYKGGTHASPRQHVRRGHYRTYASGKRVFIESFIVGSKEAGVVVKDYVCST